ncbi:MAG TPA: hypothetical protein VFX35_10520 [Solirubrobacterales bacterium]|nr:hypothetical protein [Solirubrobacterales bacterium]
MPDATIEQVEVELDEDFRSFGRGHLRAMVDGGLLTIQGWALGQNSIATSLVLTDQADRPVARIPIDAQRPDIAGGFPDVPGAGTSGFRVVLRPSGSGSGQIRARVQFEDRSEAELGGLACKVLDGGAGVGAGPGWSPVTPEDSESQKVLFGREGWLYLRGDTNDILGQHTGRVKLGEERRRQWRQVLWDRMAVSEALGIPWVCVVAADKESVYPEYLPEGISPSAHRPVHEFLELAGAVGAPVTYALDRLRAAKEECEVYARTDTHWNFRGAYEGYRIFCEEMLGRGLELEPLGEEDLEWVEGTVDGDLGRKVQPEPLIGPMVRVRFKRPSGRVVFDNGVHNHGRVMRFESDRPGPTCVLFGESFCDFLVPFLQETFGRLVFVHTSMFVPEVLKWERPDVVLSLPLERFLIRVPNDANAFEDLRALALKKGGELPWSTGKA